MKRFTFYIYKGDNILKLEEPLTCSSNSRMIIRNIDVFWDFKNVQTDSVINYGTDISFPAGYYTFESIEKKLKDSDITLSLNKHDGTCTIFGEDHPIKLKSIAPILGFKLNQTITANTSTTSSSKVNINNGIKFLVLGCNLVKFSNNYFNGDRSQTIACLPVTTEQNLFGTVSHYSDRYCAVPMYNGTFQGIAFFLTSNNKQEFNADVLVEFEIY